MRATGHRMEKKYRIVKNLDLCEGPTLALEVKESFFCIPVWVQIESRSLLGREYEDLKKELEENE